MQQPNPIRRWYQTFEKCPKTTGLITAIALGSLAIISFLWRLGSTGLVDETEPMFAEAARQMLITGDWITPYFNEATRFDKPPLIYWCMAIAYRLVGANAWGARLPSALAVIALMGFLFWVLRRYGFPSAEAAVQQDHPATQRKLWLAAWIGVALLALNLQTIVWARQGVSDMLLNGCIGSGLICFFLGYAAGGKAINRVVPHAWYIAAYALLALAVLAKGPVGIVLPGLIILAFLLYLGKFWEVFLEAKPLFGGALFLGITLPWYILVILRNGQAYIDAFFGYHNFERFTAVVNGHDAPWYFYFPVVLVGFMPWSAYLPVAIARFKLHQPKQWRSQPRQAHLGLFACTWFLAIFGFFTVAVTKLPSYTIPLLPAASILVALLWSQMLEEPQKNSPGFWWSCVANVVILAILAGFMVYSPQVIGYDPAAPNLDQVYAQSVIPKLGSLIWGMGMLVSLFFLFRSRLGLLLTNILCFTAFILLALFPTLQLLDSARQAMLRELAFDLPTVQRPQEPITMIGFEKPSLVFYSHQPIHFFHNVSEAIAYFKAEIPPGTPSLLLITQDSYLEKLDIAPQSKQLLETYSPYLLLRIESPESVRRAPKIPKS